jgi:hypothetical protein
MKKTTFLFLGEKEYFKKSELEIIYHLRLEINNTQILRAYM